MCEIERYYQEVNKFKSVVRDGYVLFVDDDKEILRMLMVCAKMHNLDCKMVCSYEQAEDLLQNETDLIKCVVIDLHLHGQRNGDDVINYIEDNCPQVPYVVYSADEDALRVVKKVHRRATTVLKGTSLDNLMKTMGVA